MRAGPSSTQIIKIVLVFVALAVILWGVDFQEVWSALTPQTLVAILVMQVFLFTATLFVAYRHAILIRSPRAPIVVCLEAVVLSAGLNLVMPMRISEAIKATYLRKSLDIPLANGTAAIFVERLFDVAIVAAIALIGFVGVYFADPLPLVLLFVGALVALSLVQPGSKFLVQGLEDRQGRFVAFVRDNAKHVVAILDRRKAITVAGLTVMSWGVHYFAVWLFFFVQPEYRLDPSQAAIVFGAIIFASAVPALPGGLGAIQAAVVLALTGMGFTFPQALALSIAIHIAEILISAIATPVLLLSKSTGLRDLTRELVTTGRK